MDELMELTLWPRNKRADGAKTKPWAWKQLQDDTVTPEEGVSFKTGHDTFPCVAPPTHAPTHAPTPLTCADHACRFLSYTLPPEDSDKPAYGRYCIGALLWWCSVV